MISVVVPAYNHRDHVLATLDSVFAQTYGDYEVIVVNDGSPDDTREVLRPLAEAGRIRYFEQPNRGQPAARNRGLAEARGDFVAFLDDDDLWPPDKLEWQARELREHPESVLVYGRPARIRRNGMLVPAEDETFPTGRVERAFLEGCWLLSPGQALIRTAALRELGGFDTSLWGSDDWDLYIRLSGLGEFRYVERIALHYRVHAGNASGDALRHVANHYRVVRKHADRYRAAGGGIGLLVTHLYRASLYFNPNLLRFARAARSRGEYGRALRAYAHAAVLDPRVHARLQRLASPWRRPGWNDDRGGSETGQGQPARPDLIS